MRLMSCASLCIIAFVLLGCSPQPIQPKVNQPLQTSIQKKGLQVADSVSEDLPNIVGGAESKTRTGESLKKVMLLETIHGIIPI